MRAAANRYVTPSYVANTGAGLPCSAALASGSFAASSSGCAAFARRETMAPCPLTTASRSGSGESAAAAARSARSSGRVMASDGSAGGRVASISSGTAATARGERGWVEARFVEHALLAPQRFALRGEERMAGERPCGIELAGRDTRRVNGWIGADEEAAGLALLEHVAFDGGREQPVLDPRRE